MPGLLERSEIKSKKRSTSASKVSALGENPYIVLLMQLVALRFAIGAAVSMLWDGKA